MAAMNISIEKLHELIAAGRDVLVDYRAPWCGYCRRIDPAYEEIAEEYAGVLDVVKINMDDDDALWDTEEVELIPTIRLYRGGKALGSIVAPESKAVIEDFIAQGMPRKKKSADKHVYDMLVIGGGPAGYTAALYAARAGLDVIVLERLSAGGQMVLTSQIDNYPGFADGINGVDLALQMQQQAQRFGAVTKSGDVTRLDLNASPKLIETADSAYHAKTVVIATGANPRELGLPGEKELVGRGVAYCAACDGMFYKGKTVVVAGGGNSAAEDALLLSRIAKKVMLVHRRDTLRADKVYVDPLMKAENIEFVWNSTTEELLHDERLTGVRVKNVHTGEYSDIECDGIFVSIGRVPATKLTEGQLDMDKSGYIIAGETTRTSIPGVFAAGDVRTKQLRQVVTAVADGAAAAHSAAEYIAENAL